MSFGSAEGARSKVTSKAVVELPTTFRAFSAKELQLIPAWGAAPGYYISRLSR
ncbi:MAG TPA: hypothetical protein VEW46_04880 [Pyrinomonadaceae bacterium]|nr:hypothetical protein [Pyrinomonadaceae bacterium]